LPKPVAAHSFVHEADDERSDTYENPSPDNDRASNIQHQLRKPSYENQIHISLKSPFLIQLSEKPHPNP
jgi:hypothetical protein